VSNTDVIVDAAGRWFLQSGIQEPNGGVARFYRSDLKKNANVSTEITGYTIGTLLFLYQRTGQSEYLDAAIMSSHFLTRTAWNARLRSFPFECPAEGSGSLAYFFDCGIIVRALLATWRVTNETEFRDTAIAAGRGMSADFKAREAIHPILSLPDKRPLGYQPRWSASPGAYQLKAAMAWYDLYETTGEMGFLRDYEFALDGALRNDLDFLAKEPECERIMDRLHAYLYFLEGLLPMLHRADCAHTFRAGLDRAATNLREIAPQFARSDVYAQMLRARIYGEKLGSIPLDVTAATHEASEAAAFQLESDDVRVDGGFGFGRKAREMLPFVNPVSTAFCTQALASWDDRNNHVLAVCRHDLI
jgi:hypothetical protein